MLFATLVSHLWDEAGPHQGTAKPLEARTQSAHAPACHDRGVDGHALPPLVVLEVQH
jgi:hypothetical protein